jgi:hypothetical protein
VEKLIRNFISGKKEVKRNKTTKMKQHRNETTKKNQSNEKKL